MAIGGWTVGNRNSGSLFRKILRNRSLWTGTMNETNAYKAALFKNERTTVERVEKFISEHYFKDCNLRGRLYGRSYPVYVKHCDFGSDIVTFQEAVEALSIRGAEVDIGFKFGPTWTTHWFEIGINLPEDCQSEKKIVLRVDPDCEALLWSVDGRPIKGIILLLIISFWFANNSLFSDF
ncbi:unnamed protein product [Onchocerca flexuosa]|uniref:Alpha-galactosidase n=1 Tax=Onchocerca flexuosa TaxID=387005 RepID=A0A183HEZ8_9BILA|nr:unnamed protein product [Onchocerca flexuosa]